MDAPTLFILLAFVGQPEHWSPINFYSTHEQCENALMAPQFNKNGAPPVKCVTYIANSQSSPETRKEDSSSHVQSRKSTSIPSSLADDEKRLMPEVMNEFYGTFDKEKACWISSRSGPSPLPAAYRWWGVDTENTVNTDTTYCMKPIRLDATKSSGQKHLFIIAGGNIVGSEGCHPCAGVLGLIVLTPNGANLAVVATNDLYEGYDTYGGYPQGDNIVRPSSEASVTIHKLGPNETYGWVANLREFHSGYDIRWVQVYGVIGRSVRLLTTVITRFASNEASGCGQEGQERCSDLSVKYTFDTHSSANSFYPLILQVSGIRKGRPFRGNYRLVFDKSLLTYLAPNNMPDEVKPHPFIVLPEPGVLSLACKRTETLGSDRKDDLPVSMGIIVNFTTRIVQFGFYSEKVTGLDDARVAFGEESTLIGTIDRVTGDTQVKAAGGVAYSLQCRPVR